ncbi:MAG: ornithine carbamoyltransferase, partial [bacterium]|nr:ornithine carbamoyltransferase [bacterium]
IGDGENNVPHSLALGCALLGINFRCASPKGYWMDSEIVQQAKEIGGNIFETEDPKEAVKNAVVVYTDTWVSMGDTDKKKRIKVFKPYQVNKQLMQYAKKDAIFMHCLPAYRGKEVAAEVIDGPQSVVFQEAENRLHVQKALMIFLLRA